MRKQFATIDGIKRAAKKLKRELGTTYTEALDGIAIQAGYQNYAHALRAYEATSAAPPRFRVQLERFWFEKATRMSGTERLTIELSQPLTELIRLHHFKGYLSGVEARGDDFLVGTGRDESRDRARFEVCRLARALQFMEATGLKPSRSRRCYPKGLWDNRPPGADHDHCWFDPVTRGYVLTDEPYPGRADSYSAKRQEWCERHGYDIIRSDWASVYGFGTELYLIAKRGTELNIGSLVDRLQGAAAPITEIDWEQYAAVEPQSAANDHVAHSTA